MKSDSAAAGLGCLFMIGLMLYGVAVFYAGFVGIAHHWGTGWATGLLLLCLFTQFTLPMTLGAFFGAMNIWGWPWYGAFAFAAPGLAAMLLFVPFSFFGSRSKTSYLE